MDELIVDSAHDFWHNHVLAGVPPEPDFEHKSTLPMLRRMYPGTNGETVSADELDETLLYWAKVAGDAAAKAEQRNPPPLYPLQCRACKRVAGRCVPSASQVRPGRTLGNRQPPSYHTRGSSGKCPAPLKPHILCPCRRNRRNSGSGSL